MNSFLSAVRDVFSRTVYFLKGLGTKRKWVAVVFGVLLLGTVGYALLGPRKATDDALVQKERSVTLLSIGEYSTNLPALSLVGTVRSESEATITAEAQGIVSNVYRGLGDTVPAGTIIAELENASQRAQLAQAQAARDAAQAQLEKIKRGTRDEQLSVLLITHETARDSLTTAELTAENTVRSAYATVDDAVRRSVDQIFSNPTSNQPTFIPQTSNAQYEIDAESKRSSLQTILTRQEKKRTEGSLGDIDAELQTTAEELSEVRDLVTRVIAALNGATPAGSVTQAQLDAWRLTINTALTGVNTARTNILSAQDTLSSKRSALSIAEKNLEQGQTGGQREDVAASEAALRQAEAGVQTAQVALQKTLLRTPISGTVESIAIERGEFVSQLSPVARVANINALEIIAYASERDLQYLRVGSEVVIGSGASGVITRVAPSLDPTTKRVEIRIGVKDGAPLTNGQSVSVAIARAGGGTAHSEIRVPLSALKVSTDSAFVFSLNEAKRLVAHEVTIESILGSDVVISGVSPTLTIIKDSRGLQAGEKVEVR